MADNNTKPTEELPPTFPLPKPTGDPRYDALLSEVHDLVLNIYKTYDRVPSKITIDNEYILRAVKTFVVGRMYKYDINSRRSGDATEMAKLRKTPEGRKLIEQLLKRQHREEE